MVFGDFNARLGHKRPGEDAVMGECGFGHEAHHGVEVPNRDLLLEYCFSSGLFVANTCNDVPAFRKVTYHEPRVPPMSPIDEADFLCA